jgi:hypothetical protein
MTSSKSSGLFKPYIQLFVEVYLRNLESSIYSTLPLSVTTASLNYITPFVIYSDKSSNVFFGKVTINLSPA